MMDLRFGSFLCVFFFELLRSSGSCISETRDQSILYGPSQVSLEPATSTHFLCALSYCSSCFVIVGSVQSCSKPVYASSGL